MKTSGKNVQSIKDKLEAAGEVVSRESRSPWTEGEIDLQEEAARVREDV